jgi:hypothetical protein
MERQIDIDNGYNFWYPIGQFNLQNAIDYEVAIKVVSAVGESLLSPLTVIIQPKDTPAQLNRPLVRALLTDQQILSQPLADPNADLVVYFNVASDDANLIANNRPVLSYTIIQQEVVDEIVNNVPTGSLIDSGAPTQIVLSLPAAPATPSFALLTPYTFNGQTYRFRHVIPGTSADIGKKFRFYVYASNINGDGPTSLQQASTDFIVPFKLADTQSFTIEHTKLPLQVGQTTPLELYDGKMNISIASLASANGGQGVRLNSTNALHPANNFYDREMKLKVESIVGTTVTPVFDNDVRVVQEVTSTIVNGVTTWTPTGKYNINFDMVDINPAMAGIQSLNDLLALGNKYRFSLQRKTRDPAYPNNSPFLSAVAAIERTKFKSADSINRVQAYAINDDLTPVRTQTDAPALRLVFNQLTTNQMGGMDAFNSQIQYFAFRSSLPTGLPPLNHDSNLLPTAERSFIIEVPTVGQQTPLYVRHRAWNSELLTWVDGAESVPVVSDSGFTYPQAPSQASLSITKLNGTQTPSITVSYARQNIASSGNPGSETFNRMIISDLSNGNIVYNQLSSSISNLAATVTTTISSGLVNGKSYALFIITERKYSKLGLNNDGTATLRFNTVTIRNSYITTNFVMNGIPSAPTQIELFPRDSIIDCLFDGPTENGGVSPDTFKTHFYLSKDPTSFPSEAAFTYASVADVSGFTTASLTKAFASKALATSRDNAVDLEKYVDYYFAARVIGTVGGETTDLSFTNTLSDGLLNNVVIDNPLLLIAATQVPQSNISGVFSAVQTVVLSDIVPAPTGVDCLAESGKLVVQWTKNATVSDVIIVVDNNDSGVTPFDSRLARTQGNFTGLFNLDQAFSNGTLSHAFGPSGFNFRKISNDRYSVDIGNLVNGQTYNISIRHITYMGNDFFSQSVTIPRAPEAPSTAILNPRFNVNSGTIAIAYDMPANLGGAGIGNNSSIRFRIVTNRVNSDGSLTLISNNDTTSLTANVPGLIDGANYTVEVAALYIKGSDSSIVIGPFTQINSLTMLINNIPRNVIRPNPAAVGPVLAVSATGAQNVINPNTIFANVTTANLLEQTNYPLIKHELWISQKSNPIARQKVTEWFADPSGFSPSISLSQSVINSFSTSLGTHTKPLNGFTYTLELVSIPNYTFAPAPPSKSFDVSPFGKIAIIESAGTLGGVAVNGPTAVVGSSGKTYRFFCNLNGGGSINNIVGIAKTANSTALVVKNLSSTTLPSFSVLGALSDVDGISAGQVVMFEIAFSELSQSLSDGLLLVASLTSTDVFGFPPGAFQ